MCDITGREPICSGLQVGLTDMQEQPLSEHIPPNQVKQGAEERLNFNDGSIYLLLWQGPYVASSRKQLKPPRVREGCRKMELDDGSESRGEGGKHNTSVSTATTADSTVVSGRTCQHGSCQQGFDYSVSVVPISPSSPPASFTRPRSRKIRISRVRAGYAWRRWLL